MATTPPTSDLDLDALLLMYLAGELSAKDRQGVDRRLAGDAELRGRLDALRALSGGSAAAFDALDRRSPTPADVRRAAGRAAAAVRRWQDGRRPAARLPAAAPGTPADGDGASAGRRRPRWAVPAAAAAVLAAAGAVGFVVLRDPPSTRRGSADRTEWASPDDREFRLAALTELARLPELNVPETPGTPPPPTSLPAVAMDPSELPAWASSPGRPVALGDDGDGYAPVLDVPLDPRADRGPSDADGETR